MVETLFADLQLSEDVLAAVKDMGFETATPIQAQAIPVALDQKDVIGLAQTGTGKTAAFGIPLIEMTDPNLKVIQSLVMCPTRELAVQVGAEIEKLASHRQGLKLATVYGGDSMERQIRALKGGAQIVVGTPGRIMDHMERGNIKLDEVRFVVLDEADIMLDMGFREDMEDILRDTPEDRQTMLFSATMSREIQEISRTFLTDPVVVEIARKELTADTIVQKLYMLHEDRKADAFCSLMWMNHFKSVLVFCNTKRKVDELMEQLSGRGFSVEGLHGDMRQGARNQVMSKYRKGISSILIATDVAARGIDVDTIEAVFNYDLPNDPESYVHRIGRTGRAGRDGSAFAFATPRQQGLIKQIERYARIKIEQAALPTLEEILTKGRESLVDQLVDLVEGEEFPELDGMVASLEAKGVDALHALKAALWLQLQEREDKATKFVQNIPTPRQREERPDRGDRPERGEGGEREKLQRPERGDRTPEGRTKLWMDLGKKAGGRVNDIVGSVAGESGIPGKDIFPIKVMDYNTWFEVPDEWVERIMEGVTGKFVRGKEVSITYQEKGFDRDSAPREGGFGGGRSFGGDRGGYQDRGPRGAGFGGQGGGGSFGNRPYGDRDRQGGYHDRGQRSGGGNRSYGGGGGNRGRSFGGGGAATGGGGSDFNN